MISKELARQEVKSKRRELTHEQCLSWSHTIADKIISSEVYRDNNNIFLYVSCRNEVDTEYLITESQRLGKRVFLPKVSGKDIDFYGVDDISQLIKGCFGIMEPDVDKCEKTSIRQGLFIMPGVAFDEQCNRAGYGAGYYDRYLAGPSRFVKIALAFEFQIYTEIQSEIHDIRPDYIFTEKRIIGTE